MVNILLLSSPLHINDVHLGGLPGGLLYVLLHHRPRQKVGGVLGQDEVGGPGEDVVGRRLLPWFPADRPVLPVQVNSSLPPALVLSDTEAWVEGRISRLRLRDNYTDIYT